MIAQTQNEILEAQGKAPHQIKERKEKRKLRENQNKATIEAAKEAEQAALAKAK